MSTHPDSSLHGRGAGSKTINLAAIQQEYTKDGLKEGDLPDNPLSLFNRWLYEAIDARVEEPIAMLVGTVFPEGRPSTHTVLLKDLHDGKFIFYTSYGSRKGSHLAKNPCISLSFVWHALEGQVYIEGISSKIPAGGSDAYSRQRPYKSRTGARTSPQNRPLKSRMQLIHSFVAEATRRVGREVECPVYWGGYTTIPERIELWQGRANRLYNRFLCILQADGNRQKERLTP